MGSLGAYHLKKLENRDDVAREVMCHARLGIDVSYRRYSFDAEKQAAMKALAHHLRTLTSSISNGSES